MHVSSTTLIAKKLGSKFGLTIIENSSMEWQIISDRNRFKMADIVKICALASFYKKI